MKRRTRNFTVGLAAIGLGAGAVAGAPTVAGAQDADAQNDTSTTEEMHSHSSRGADRLAEAVTEGIITQEQADAITDHFAEKRAERQLERGDSGDKHHDGRRHGHHKSGHRSDVVTDLLGLTSEEIRTFMDSGQTLAELAEANDVTREALIDALVANTAARLDEKVANGQLTQEEAETHLAEHTAKVSERIDAVPGDQGDHGNKDRGKRGHRGHRGHHRGGR